ncbi:hypothetical protein BDV96DRAFT_574828 [Lophiotrema nucula]|uniref:AAA+ ATPase domain-containing protein n=1 Tax=Lophiotrema nucula TaxID=690887 RepID=A0A6A5Z8Q7_9PLEO|nr:hypothetical protein BDV96DRAFT_574828 [Lophiotrema nucula]
MAEPYTYPGVKPNAGSYPNHSHEAAAASASEDNFHDSLRKGPILEKNESNKSPTTCLYMALERLIRSMAARSTQSGNILLITSSSQMPEKPDFERNALSEFEEQLFHSTIDVVPVRTRAQKELLTDVVHYQFEVSNSRALIRDLKQRSLKHFNVSVLEPYARWPSMKLFSGCKRLFEDQLSTKDLRKAGRLLTEKFDGDLDERRLSKAIHDIYHPEEMAKRRGMLLREWNKSTGYYRGSYRYRDSDDDSEPAHGKWSNFSPKIQALLQELEKNEGLYHWENSFIDCLVDPESVAEGWDDVELDKDVQDTISQITRQVTNRQHAYGVLKTSRIGGVLLYGPPGTGKTLMARVLARESGAVTICVSAAEIESKWIGESEKAIKGLFSLGQKLAPSIIFIDEVDSMFGRREGTDSYSRGRVNQFLTAMDGIVKCENPPFVLVASNLPHRLDPAILRRVPSRLYLRLPPAEARKGLFKIFLRGENLHPEVDFDKLADATKAFSGSDIQTMCVQAALVCEASTAGLDEDGVRLLTQEHFRVAAKRCAPTVSRTAMLHIKAFAKEFDPIGWQKMQADKASAEAGVAKESPATQSRTSGDALTPKTIPTVPVRRPVYISKPIGRNQIRLLSLANSAAAREPENLPQFSMETVGLDDLTPDYQAFAKDRHLEQPKEQIKAWFHQMIEGASGNPPSSESEELETLIVRIPLIKPRFTWGDYICLSYVWGDEQERECITLDGQVFSVTKNLYMALQRWIKTPEVLRHGLKLWVDAISINQADLSERAQEVLRIGEIYSSALCVRAWIGQLTPELAPHLPTVRAWLDNSSSDRGSGRTSVPNSRVQQALWTLLTSLSSEKYWKRVWIMQEISLASSLVFWFGEWSFTTWEILNLPTVLNIQNPFSFPESSSLKLVGDRMQLLRKAFPNLVRLTRLRSYNASKGFDIVDTIFLAQSAEATDHRDKVFGVLSLFPQEIAMQIQPNYDSAYTSADTYIMFSKICLQQQGGLDRLAHWANRYRPHSSLPSWTFDLNAPSTAIDTSYELMTVLGVENNSQPLRSFSTIPAFQDSDKIMVCTGKFVDTVRSITADYSCNMREDETDTDMENTIPLEMEEESGPPCLPDEYEARLYNDLVPMSSKLSLARVLSMNPDYEFDHGPSMLDVPWNLPDLIKSAATDIDAMQTDDLSELTLDDARRLFDLNDIDTQTSNAGFAPIIDRARWYHIFTSVLHANATFNCHGISLQDYFSTAQELDSKVNQAMIDGEISYGALGPCRLFTTREGRLGLGPKFMELGDRVAMLSSCDTPVVLREKGMFFEFVGGCFVDGLMKGKAVRDLEDGKLMMEIIKIC